MIDVTVPWKPHAKGRPRFVKATGTAYTPAETRKAEAAIRDAFLESVGPDFEPFTEPVSIEVELGDTEFRLVIRECDKHTNLKLRGDIDNYMKTIGDALNKVAWVDDRQIRESKVVKR